MRHLPFALCLFLLLIGCSTTVDPSPTPAVFPGPVLTPTPYPTVIAGPAPERAFTLLDGTEATLADYQGKGVLLNFWATWCVPCRSEMPLLAEISTRYQDEIVVLGVNYLENQESAAGFVRQFKIPFPIALDPRGLLADDLNVRGLPTTVYINAAGEVIGGRVGPVSEAELEAVIPTLSE